MVSWANWNGSPFRSKVHAIENTLTGIFQFTLYVLTVLFIYFLFQAKQLMGKQIHYFLNIQSFRYAILQVSNFPEWPFSNP